MKGHRALAFRWAACGLVLVFSALGGGCASGLAIGELPDAVIAVGYLDASQARRERERALALEERRSRGRRDDARPQKPGVAHVRDIGRYLSYTLGARSDKRSAGLSGHRRDADEQSPRLALLDPKTLELTILPEARPGSIPVDWSPDRKTLLFSQIARGYDQLFEFDLENREVRPVTSEPGAHSWGCYGPDGRIVVEHTDFSEQGVSSRLLISKPGGGRFEPLTEGPADSQPSCSADGSSLAYLVGPRGEGGRVMVRSPVLDGVPQEIGKGIDPVFTPDAKLVFYTAPTKVSTRTGVETRWRLRRSRASGLGRGGFEMGPIDHFEPAVSPDGKIVAYVGVDSKYNYVLYVRRVDGSGERILFNEGAALGPVW